MLGFLKNSSHRHASFQRQDDSTTPVLPSSLPPPPPVVRWLLLAACAILPYLFGLSHGFVFDDHGTIVENAFLRNPAQGVRVLSLQTLGDASVIDGNRPVVLLSYFLDRALWGLHPAGYHGFNLLLHAAVTLLLYFLARRIAGRPETFWPLAAALLFALHPAISEAVQAPSYREDLLCVFFMLASLRCALALVPGASLASVACAVLALLSKESALVTPLLIGWLYHRLALPARRGLMLTALTGLLAVGFLVGWFGSAHLQGLSAAWNGLSLRFPENLWTAPWLFLRYLRLLLLPYPLSVDYPVLPVPGPLDPRFAAGLLGLAAVAFFAFRPKRSPASIGLGWLLIAFLPVANFLPLFNPMAERYLYLMAVGFALAAGWGLRHLSSRRTAALLLALICALEAWVVVVRLQDWKSDERLWSAALSAQPRSARAHTWVGLHEKACGRRETARQRFEAADRLNPQDVSALLNLAVLAGEEGRYDEAERQLREALRRQPNNIQAHWNLAVALFHRQDEAGLVSAVEDTLRLDPFHLPAHHARLEWLLATGRLEEAQAEAEKILQIDPLDPPARQVLEGAR